MNLCSPSLTLYRLNSGSGDEDPDVDAEVMARIKGGAPLEVAPAVDTTAMTLVGDKPVTIASTIAYQGARYPLPPLQFSEGW
jgi:hypothetical protein